MKVIPVSFNKYGRFMLGHMKDLIDRGKIAIHHNDQNRFTSLLTQMKMANVINDQLDKSIHSLDLVDALRLNLLFYRVTNSSGSYG